jgi:hypothetical protein
LAAITLVALIWLIIGIVNVAYGLRQHQPLTA